MTLVKSRFSYFGLLALVLLVPLTAPAAIWYVDNKAIGRNDGSSWSNAWTTLTQQEVWSTGSNDLIYISGGPAGSSRTYSTGYIVYSDRTLQIGQDALHNGMVIFDGQNTQAQFFIQGQKNCVVSGDNGSGDGLPHIQLTNYNVQVVLGDGSSNVKLDHLSFYSTIRFQGATNIEISYCQMTAPNNADYLMNFSNSGGGPGCTSYTNSSIHNCTLLAPRTYPTYTYPGEGADFIQGGANMSVYSNTFNIYFTNFTEGQHQDGWQSVGPYIAMFDNTMANIPNYGIYCEFYGNGGNILFYNNTVVQNAPMSYDTGLNVGVVIGPQAQTGMTFSNIVVANNTFVDMFGRSALALGQANSTNTYVSCFVVNNLVYNCGGSGFPAFEYYNLNHNILVTNGVTIANNDIEAGGRGNAKGPVEMAVPSGSSIVPFVSYTQISSNNDLHLLSVCPRVRNQGINLSSLFPFLQNDKDGVARPLAGNWDIGAYQYNAFAVSSNSTPGGTTNSTVPPPQGLRLVVPK